VSLLLACQETFLTVNIIPCARARSGLVASRVPRATLRCAVRLTDQVLLFLPGAALRADDKSCLQGRGWEGDHMSLSPSPSASSLACHFIPHSPPCFLDPSLPHFFPRFFPLFAPLAPLSCLACPLLPPALVCNDKRAGFSSRGASIFHSIRQMRQGKNLPQLSPLRTLKLGRRCISAIPGCSNRARARERERDSPVGMGMFGGVSPRYSPDPYQVAVNNWGVSHLFQRTPCSEIDIDSSDSDEPEWPTSAIFCIAHPNTTTWSTSCSRPAQRTEKLRRSDSLLSSERG